MNTSTLFNQSDTGSVSSRRRISAVVFLFFFIGFLVVVGGFAGTMEAASNLKQGQGDNPATLTGDQRASVTQLVMQGNTVLHLNPSSAQVTIGSVVAVQIRLENIENLYGIEVHLAFDKDVVQVEDDNSTQGGTQITPGEIPYPDFFVQNTVDNSEGRLDYAVVQLSPRSPASGSGVVATVRFRGMRAGISAVHFGLVKLASPGGVEIPVTLQDGTIVVIGSGNTPTPEPTDTPSPTATAGFPGATPVSTSSHAVYVVRTGDTAFSIARRFGISLDALAMANNLPSSFAIGIGQMLIIPGVPGPTCGNHRVQAGETLYSISRHYGTTVETLAAVNHIPYPWHVRLGETLQICPP